MEASVVITGIGIALPLGVCRLKSFWADLLAGRSEVRPRDLDGGGTVRAALMPPWEVEDWVESRQLRRMSPLSKMAIAAARTALTDAGFDEARAEKTAVFFSSRFGSTEFLREYHAGLLPSRAASPFLFTNGVANAPAGHISLEFGFQGPCFTFMGGPSSAVTSLRQAATWIRRGLCDAALVGAAEELSPFFLASLAGWQEGTAAREAGEVPPGEGSVFLVLESATPPSAQGAPAWATLGGIRQHTRAGDRGVEPGSLLGPVPPTDRDLFVAVSEGPGGSGRGELDALAAAAGERKERLLAHAVRYNLGEAYAVSVLTQTVVACLALAHGQAPPAPTGRACPGLHAETAQHSARHALVTLVSADGQLGFVELEKGERDA
jgi:hypothetical protein